MIQKSKYFLITILILLIPFLAFGLNIDSDSNDCVDILYGGTNSALTDPGGDRILFWDDSESLGSNFAFLSLGSGLTISGTTLSPVPDTIAAAITAGAYTDNSITSADIHWDEPITVPFDKKIQFGDTGIYIFADDDGILDIVADTSVDISNLLLATNADFGDFDITSVDKLEGVDNGQFIDLGNTNQIVISCDGAGTPFSTPDIDITGTSYFDDDSGFLLDKKIYFGDTGVFIESDADGYLDLDADTGIRLNQDVTASGTVTVGTSTVTLSSSSQVFTMAGTGGTYDENLTFDLDVENIVNVGTGTGVLTVDFGTINLATDALDLSAGDITNIDAVNYGTKSDTDGDYDGMVITMTVDSGVGNTDVGQVMHVDSDGELINTDNDADATMPAIGVLVESGTGAKKILISGRVTHDAWNWTTGDQLYVSGDPTTTTGLTASKPGGASGDRVQEIGVAVSDDTVLINVAGSWW